MTEEQQMAVLQNENLVFYIIKKLNLYDKFEDFYDIGMIGLVNGVKTYDPNKGVKLSSYVGRCIENEILYYLRKKRPNCISLETPVIDDLDFYDIIPDQQVNVEEEVETKIMLERMENLFDTLSPREQAVLNNLYGIHGHNSIGQYELAKRLNTTQSTVFKVKKSALEKLRVKLMEKKYAVRV